MTHIPGSAGGGIGGANNPQPPESVEALTAKALQALEDLGVYYEMFQQFEPRQIQRMGVVSDEVTTNVRNLQAGVSRLLYGGKPESGRLSRLIEAVEKQNTELLAMVDKMTNLLNDGGGASSSSIAPAKQSFQQNLEKLESETGELLGLVKALAGMRMLPSSNNPSSTASKPAIASDPQAGIDEQKQRWIALSKVAEQRMDEINKARYKAYIDEGARCDMVTEWRDIKAVVGGVLFAEPRDASGIQKKFEQLQGVVKRVEDLVGRAEQHIRVANEKLESAAPSIRSFATAEEIISQLPGIINNTINFGQYQNVLVSHLLCSGKLLPDDVPRTVELVQQALPSMDLHAKDDSNLWVDVGAFGGRGSGNNVLRTAVAGASAVISGRAENREIVRALLDSEKLQSLPAAERKQLFTEGDNFRRPITVQRFLLMQGHEDLAQKVIELGADIDADFLVLAAASAGTTQHGIKLLSYLLDRVQREGVPQLDDLDKQKLQMAICAVNVANDSESDGVQKRLLSHIWTEEAPEHIQNRLNYFRDTKFISIVLPGRQADADRGIFDWSYQYRPERPYEDFDMRSMFFTLGCDAHEYLSLLEQVERICQAG